MSSNFNFKFKQNVQKNLQNNKISLESLNAFKLNGI